VTRYRRASDLVVYWRQAGPVAFSCRSGTRSAITDDVLDFLNIIRDWHTVPELVERQPWLGSGPDVRTLLNALVERHVVERDGDASAARLWDVWSPEAAFFHFGTRNPTSIRPRREYELELQRKAQHTPPPPATKTMRGRRVSLAPKNVNRAFGRTLRSRRTWRQFSDRPVSMDDLAALLELTFGVQKREWVEGQGRLVRKTSPSGGARHSIEAYVLALNVKGLERGSYHYDADTHELVYLKRSARPAALTYALADQDYFTRAGALIVMAAMFERAMWRYPFNRAYRSILAEAGHLGQTFCLVATALSLAPFCTMAFRDRELEAMIGVDGVNESAMYVVGVGTRPRGRVAHPGRISSSAKFKVQSSK
jgi:SagB-type dehydrogenase family enzyme